MGALRTCTIEGCEKPYKARGWCAMHHRRWWLTGHPGPAGRLDIAGEITSCTVDDCERLKRSSGAKYCEMHYYRLRRTGSLNGPKRYDNPVCSVEGCDSPTRDTGMCDRHATRFRRHGDPHRVLPLEERDLARGERNPHWTGDEASYAAVHQRVKKARGVARKHLCVDCEGQAKHWSYDHADPNERFTEVGAAYSVSIEHYEARCVPCHKKYDLALLAAKREAS